tara:strand:- start:3217 stop:3438 length:222 start_codon:yes stop_codon:yes gene_type:complete
MGVRILRKKLSKEQVEKGIIYTSTLSTSRNELQDDTVHEIYEGAEDITETKNRLEDTKFFNNSHYNFNIIRTK